MFTIENNRIRVIQGDTGIIELELDNHSLIEGDVVYFTVKEDYGTEVLILKEITEFENGKAKIVLTSEDTSLKQGTYKYDIQCNLADGRVDTVISPSIFQVLGGITDV